MLRLRLIFGTALALLVLAALLVDGYLAGMVAADAPAFPRAHPVLVWLCNGAICTAVVLAFTLLATRELLRFARQGGRSDPFPVVAYAFGAGLVLGPYISFNSPLGFWRDEAWGMMWLACALGLAFLLQAARRRAELAMINLAVTLLIIFYAGGLGGFMTKLRMEVGGWGGVTTLLFSMFIVKMTDVGAFFVGGLVGRTKLIEWLSPKKTWEGFFGGVATAIVCAVALGLYLQHVGAIALGGGGLLTACYLAVFGLFMAVSSVAGDLFASLLKRDAALKDSGRSIPGMGGILDVLDSPLLAAPAAWFFWTRLAALAS